jgi:hypothetical protein
MNDMTLEHRTIAMRVTVGLMSLTVTLSSFASIPWILAASAGGI